MADHPRQQPNVCLPRSAPPTPAWATTSGTDVFGTWADIEVPVLTGQPVTQRLRLIPKGRFTMGSPEDEPGRYNDEGPRHEKIIAEDFWMFDSPCTQALWDAVMPENPSYFRSPTRPVEKVSFDDAKAFLTEINKRRPGLNLCLPSEAQWEYACRAGTTDATYAGPMVIQGDHNAPVLDKIAWYGGNSGQGYELNNGLDTSELPAKQYQDKKAGTHPMRQKLPNAWGLYDMLGNVWEWCEDFWHEDYNGAPPGGAARERGGAARRVIRGGSWAGEARYVRAADRYGNDPGNRDDNLGFRCARVQSK